jgi:hypothetical protein
MSERKRQRLDEHGATTAYAHNGKVEMTLWTASRRPVDDPAIYELTPSEALDLAMALVKGAKTAMQSSIGSR